MRVVLALAAIVLAHGTAHAAEICGNGADDDANAVADEGCDPYAVTGVCDNPLGCDLVRVAPSTGSLVIPMAPDLDPNVPYGPGLALRRTYMSLYEPGAGAHGYRKSMGRWHHNFMSWLDVINSTNMVVHVPGGRDVLFTASGSPTGGYQYYVAQVGAHYDYLRQSTSSPYGIELRALTGDELRYTSAGQLTEIRDSLATANVVALAYDGSGYLSTVTDASVTRRLVFTYASNKLTKASFQVKNSGGTFVEETYVTYGYTSGEITTVGFAGTSAHAHTYSGGYLTKLEDTLGNTYLQLAYAATGAAGRVVRVNSGRGYFGRDYASSLGSCSGETVQYFNRANTLTCDDDSDCGSGYRCGGETNPASANTGACYRASSCLTGAATLEDLTASVDPILPCDGACADIATYDWYTGTGNSKLELAGVEDAEGHWRSYDYNADGLVTMSATGDTDSDPTNASSGSLAWTFYGNSSFPGRVTERRSLSVLKAGGSCSDTVSTDCARTIQTWNSDGLLSAYEQRGFDLDSGAAANAFTYTDARTYDSVGRLTGIDGPLSGTDDETTFSYWTNGVYDAGMLRYVNRETAPSVFLTTEFSAYDAWGKANTILAPGSIYACRDYDTNRGWLTSKTQIMSSGNTCASPGATAEVTSYDHDVFGRLTKTTRPEGNCEIYAYNGRGRMTSAKRRDDCNAASNGDTVTYGYDDDNHITGTRYRDDSDTLVFEDERTYFDSGRLKRKVNPAAGSYGIDFDYYEDGTVMSMTGENAVGLTTWDRDGLDRASKVYVYNDAVTYEDSDIIYPAGSTTRAASETTDAAGYDRFVVRDDLGRLVKILSADNERTLFLYDDAGRPVQRIDPDSVSSYFTYDSIGRLLTVDHGHEACGSGSSAYETEFTYDALPGSCPTGLTCTNLAGKLATVSTRLLCDSAKGDNSYDMATSYGYDRAGRLLEEGIRDDASRVADTFYTWDKNGNRTSITYPSEDGAKSTFGGGTSNGDKDKIGTLLRSTKSGDTTLLSDVLWMPRGPVKQYDQANTIGGTAIRATLTWNKGYRATQVKSATGGTTRWQLAFTEDLQGRQTVRDFTNAQSGVQDQYIKWDWQGRVRCDSGATGACPTSGSNLRTNLTTFNAGDQRTAWVHKGVATGTQNGSVTYTAGAQIDYITLDSATLDFVTDARGNRSSDDVTSLSNDTRSYTYDANRRVRTITGKFFVSGVWATYVVVNAYDQRGRRVLRSYTVGGTESLTTYSYDEANHLVESVHTPDITVSGTYTIYSMYWLADRPVAMYATGRVAHANVSLARYFFNSDERGDVTEMTSWPSSGDATVVWANNPDAFGWDDVLVGGTLYQPFGKDQWIREDGTAAWHGTTTVGRPALSCRSGACFDPLAGEFLQSGYVGGGEGYVLGAIARTAGDDESHCSTGLGMGEGFDVDVGGSDEIDFPEWCPDGEHTPSGAPCNWAGPGGGGGAGGGNNGEGEGGVGDDEGSDPQDPQRVLDCIDAIRDVQTCIDMYGESDNRCAEVKITKAETCDGIQVRPRPVPTRSSTFASDSRYLKGL